MPAHFELPGSKYNSPTMAWFEVTVVLSAIALSSEHRLGQPRFRGSPSPYFRDIPDIRRRFGLSTFRLFRRRSSLLLPCA
jgi:hypothetical protein